MKLAERPPTDASGRLESGRAFLDCCAQLFRTQGVTRESLDVFFAGVRALNTCLPAEEWAEFIELSDAHPVNAWLFASATADLGAARREQGHPSARVTSIRSGRPQRRRLAGYR